jgi:hypothetical protein
MKKIFTFFTALTMAMSMSAETYYYSGEKTDWNKTEMTASEDGKYAYYQATAGAHQFKIGNSGDQWAYNHTYVKAGFNGTDVTEIGDWGQDNCYTWTSVAHYILVYYPNTDVNQTEKPIICASTTLPTGITEVVLTYVLMGVKGDWENGIALTQNPNNESEYMLLGQEIAEGDSVKVAKLQNGKAIEWCDNVKEESAATYTKADNGNIILQPGKYDFYYDINAKNIYIAASQVSTPSALDNATTTVAPIKVIENGQLVIIKNGVKYSVAGAVL